MDQVGIEGAERYELLEQRRHGGFGLARCMLRQEQGNEIEREHGFLVRFAIDGFVSCIPSRPLFGAI